MAKPVTTKDLKRFLKKKDASAPWPWQMGKKLLAWQESQPERRQSLDLLVEELGLARATLFEMVKLAKVFPKESDLPRVPKSHLKEFLPLEDPAIIKELAGKAVAEKWNVTMLRSQVRLARDPSRIRKGVRHELTPGPDHADLMRVAQDAAWLLRRIRELWPESRRKELAEKESDLENVVKAMQKVDRSLSKLMQEYEAWNNAQTPK